MSWIGLVVFLGFVVDQSSGWWCTGHMVVARIAETRLIPSVKDQVYADLGLFAPHYPNAQTMIDASCWPDDILKYGEQFGAHWHFSNIAIVLDPLPQGFSGGFDKNVSWAIKKAEMNLNSSKARFVGRGDSIRNYIHFVGDIHQPCHCTTLFSPEFPSGDQGGNLFLIDHPRYPNLHQLWDGALDLMFELMERPTDEKSNLKIDMLARRITDEYPQSFFGNMMDEDDPEAWARESWKFGVDVVYQGIERNSTPSEQYIQRGQYVAKQRIALAGYRLAKNLNRIYGARSTDQEL